MGRSGFYDDLAPFYHLIYPDWDASMARQAAGLDTIIRERVRGRARKVVDVSCGIGTQSLGLAARGYEVTGSDLSAAAVARAEREADARGLRIRFSVADMREAYEHHADTFDVVLSADNAVPHLLTDADLRTALEQFYRLTRPGGLCLISVRDYARLEAGGLELKPHGVRQIGDTRYVLVQVWDVHREVYDLTLYITEDDGAGECRTRAFRSRYRMIPVDRLMDRLREAGFEGVDRIDDRFFQPVIVGTRPA